MDVSSLSLHHIAIATPSIEETAPTYELLTGKQCSPAEEVPSQGVRVAFIGHIELVEPTTAEGGVTRFLAKRGQALHHIAYRVPDLTAALAHFAELGFELIDREPRPGAGGHRVAFLHPRSTGGVLWELVEE